MKTWIWQITMSQKVYVTAARAARLRRIGEAVWPAGHHDGAHLE
jgi:hypothetical protein